MKTEFAVPMVSNESELYLVGGGPIFRLMKLIGLARISGLSVTRRIIAFLLVTWVPMFLLAVLQGDAMGATPRESFLLDLATYARFFVAIPLLIFAEGIIGPRLAQAGLRFVHQGFVRPRDYPVFEQAISRVARRRESFLATLILFGLAIFGAWTFTAENFDGGHLTGWHTVISHDGRALHYSLAGLWNNIVAVPMVLFHIYRWGWRIVIWMLFLAEIAKMDLAIVPTHADAAGGLGFLGSAHMSFGILTFALSSIISAEAAFRIIYEGAPITSFKSPLIIMLAIAQVLFLGPLLVFCPVLSRARRAGMKAYGALVIRYNRDFQKKWIETPDQQTEQLLGSADIQSLADLGTGFGYVKDMSILPFNRRSVLQLAIMTALPAIPLLLFVIPIEKIIDTLAGAIG